MTARRQAVLLIHGIGEQKPMETLRGFVRAVWTLHPAIHNKFAGHDVWSKPDDVSESYELRRLTTPQNAKGIRTDFFEFYWAHLMEGTTYGHVLAWARALLVRNPKTVPKHLKQSYWLLVTLSLVALAFAIYAAIGAASEKHIISPIASAAISVLVLPLIGFVLRSVVGDAARYLHVAPPNVQRRHEIRHAGVALLKTLHERNYDRIIVVGHSLGSVIGYDVLTHAWVNHNAQEPVGEDPPIDALDRLEEMARTDDTKNVRNAQRGYFEELRSNGNTWRVTDFITLGCPLAHSEILLAHDLEDLRAKQKARELPICLPALEEVMRDHKPIGRFSFDADGGYRKPNHAAVFGPTRWSNLYFPARWIIKGDLIGGPLQRLFGSAIQDIPVTTSQRGGFLSHTLYWKCLEPDASPAHIERLREVLDLVDERR